MEYKRKPIESIIVYFILIFGSLVMFYPFLFQLLASLGSGVNYYDTVIIPLPTEWHFDRYLLIFKNPDLLYVFKNTLLRCLWLIFFTIVTSLIAGYVFAKLRFKGRDFTFIILLSSMMVPPQVALIPSYLLYARFPLIGGNGLNGLGGHGMLDSWFVLLVPGLVNVGALFLMKQMLESLPYEYEEAARVDGAGVFRRIFGIYLMMVKPIMSVILITTFIAVWNDYLWPLVTISNPKLQVISSGIQKILSRFTTGTYIDYPTFFALTLVVMIPPVLVFLGFQKSFIQGFSMAGVKG